MEAEGGAPAPAPAPAGAPGLSPALQDLIRNIQVQQGRGGRGLELSAVLDSASLIEAISDDTAVQDMLVMHMPDELQTREELMVFIKTPQFRQTIDSLATVLSSEQMYTILMSMGIDTSAAPFPGVEGFLQALIGTLSKKSPEPEVAPVQAMEEDDADLDADLYD